MAKNLKVALVHDYLKEYGGAERVLEALHEMFPQAPIYTAYHEPSGLGTHAQRLKAWDIRTSWLQNIPFISLLISPFRIFAPMIFEGFDLEEYDLVISSCSIYFAKAVITKPETLHLSYIHTPPRYLYGYSTSFNYKKNPIIWILGEIANHFLRIYDFETSQRPDVLIANSKNIAERIKKFYRREAVIIYPPVELGKRVKREGERKYYLSVGRLVRGKGIDIIVEAFTKLNLPLKVAGAGPEMDDLKGKAGKNIQFLGQVDDSELPKLYVEAIATVVASEDEDFGIVPVESMAYGTPVIAPASGGYLETIVNGKTGILYPVTKTYTIVRKNVNDMVNSLMQALKSFDESKFKADDCRKQAEKFSLQNFEQQMLELIKKNLPKNGRSG